MMSAEISSREMQEPDPAGVAVSHISLFAAIAAELERQHPGLACFPRWFNACIEAANLICDEFSRGFRPAVPGMGFHDWLRCDERGLASEFMAFRLMNFGDKPNNHPHDPSDLGRCIRFLDAVPEARSRLADMAACGPVWAALIGAWDELEAIYREELPSGKAPRCAARMEELIKATESKE